ncbi:DoxX family protein [Alteriqipengyuania sp.]|uniref:DoxX family protein n=1 Tax=Alteriqipengyuania sp. TaxID=2800692 RepID=UPI0035116397
MARTLTRWFLALAYLAAGILHVLIPAPFVGIMPHPVPFPEWVVFWTGIAEILGAIGLAQGRSARLRRAAGIGLALYALCVWPANIQHMINDLGGNGGLGLGYHVPRMIAQPVIIWAALWAAQVTDWPFAQASSSGSTKSSSSEPL